MARFSSQIEFYLNPVVTFPSQGTVVTVTSVTVTPKDHQAFVSMGFSGGIGGWEVVLNLRTGEVRNSMKGYVDIPKDVIYSLEQRVREELSSMCRDLWVIGVGWND